ncbi:MAG TPA: serine/threonine-protein kinase, partial [Terriglobales bacterium]|nr:serine/threonine-protein kinase [Terriglobales bacterium]
MGVKYCDRCHSTYPNEFTTCPKDSTALRQTSELMQGMVIRGKYEIVEKIGAGGMGSVYRAKHLAFNEVRAIKVVSSRLLEDESLLRRFKTEAIVTRKLQHPNAVRVDDLDTTDDGRPFIVMEFVQGRDLRKVIEQEGPMPAGRALGIIRQVCAALDAAHALGITHRDIKPDNILLVKQPDGSETVKVLDFGIAKVREGAMDVGAGYTATKTGMVVGTPQYLSPEQALGKSGDAIDGRSDLYSLGIVLYEMLTGQLPFESDTPMGLLLHHIQTVPRAPHEVRPDLGISPGLSAVLMRALEKNRDLRFQTAGEMLRALEQPEMFAGTAVMGSDVLGPPTLRATPAGSGTQMYTTPP